MLIHSKDHYFGTFDDVREAEKYIADYSCQPCTIVDTAEGRLIHPPSSMMMDKEHLNFLESEFPNGYCLMDCDFGGSSIIEAILNDWGATNSQELGMLYGTVNNQWNYKEDSSYERVPGPKVAYFYWSYEDYCNALYCERCQLEEFRTFIREWIAEEMEGIEGILNHEPLDR